MVRKIYRFLGSLKLAVVVLLTLAASLAVGTTLESVYDTATAQYFVYRAILVFLLLATLGVNIVFAAVLRYPWRRRLAPFLLAHVGIITMLFGALLTDRYGLDGNLRVTEGETSSTVEMSSSALFVTEGSEVRKIPIPFVPTSDRFRPRFFGGLGEDFPLRVDQYLPHADPDIAFVADTGPRREVAAPAVKLNIKGGPMQISQDLWLWAGEAGWATQQLGPASFAIGERFQPQPGKPQLHLEPTAKGLTAHVFTSDGKAKTVTIPAERIAGYALDPGWRGGVKLRLLEWIPHAAVRTSYQPSKMQYGTQAPSPAIHVTFGKGDDSSQAWLGLGDRAFLRGGKGAVKEVELIYFPERVILPFAIHLAHFAIQYYEGSHDPASYASDVGVVGEGAEKAVNISMNEPLQYRGYTLYQASYEEAQPRPVTSILAVNRDPGRLWKYLGSIFIVSGVILLFVTKYRKQSGDLSRGI